MMYSLDSNVIIEYLRDNRIIVEKFNNAMYEGHDIGICAVAYYEVMRGFDLSRLTRKQIKFEKLYSQTEHLLLDKKSLNIAAEIYRYLCKSGQKIEDDDIFIAAITLANDAVLITDNVKHFERVPNLKVVNWKDLGE